MDRPEFIITFRDVAYHPELAQPDSTVFGYIYWMTRLKNEKCFASNETLAELSGLSVSAVRNALTRLERTGFIKRVFAEDNPREREEIIPLMGFSSILGGATAVAGGVLHSQQGTATAVALSINKSIKEEQFIITADAEIVPPKKKNNEYEEGLQWAEKRTGRRFINRTKQYSALKKAKENGIGVDKLMKRWKELEGEPFYQEHGLDWMMVISSFDKR